MMVLLSHAQYYGYIYIPGSLGFGKIGVEIFYVLSGFLMAHLYIDKPFEKSAVIKYFFARAARVLPLFYSVLFGSVLLLIVFGHSGYAYKDLIGFAQNLFILKGSGVLWSVPVEIHYYILFCLIWMSAYNGKILHIIIVIVAVDAVLLAYFWDSFDDQNYIMFWVHFFLLGLLFSRLSKLVNFEVGGLSSLLTLIASILLLPAVREYFGLPVFPIYADPFSIMFVSIIFLLSLSGRGPFSLLAHPMLRKLGDWSFSIYLLHIPIIFVLEAIKIRSLIGVGLSFLILVVCVFFGAYICRAVIEIPFGTRIRLFGDRVNRKISAMDK